LEKEKGFLGEEGGLARKGLINLTRVIGWLGEVGQGKILVHNLSGGPRVVRGKGRVHLGVGGRER